MCFICQFLKLNLWSVPNSCLFKECFSNILNIISNYIREIKHRVPWRRESLIQNFCSTVIWTVWRNFQEAMQAWSPMPGAGCMTRNPKQPPTNHMNQQKEEIFTGVLWLYFIENAGTQRVFLSEIWVWQTGFWVFPPIKNYWTHSNQCGRGLKKSIVLFVICVPFLFRSEKTILYILFSINAHYCYFDGQVNELGSVI